jgi:YHS domain-containing protein
MLISKSQNIESSTRIKIIYEGLSFFFNSEDELRLWETKLKPNDFYIVIEDDVWVDLEDIVIENTIPYNDKPICPYCQVGPSLEDEICPVCESKINI